MNVTRAETDRIERENKLAELKKRLAEGKGQGQALSLRSKAFWVREWNSWTWKVKFCVIFSIAVVALIQCASWMNPDHNTDCDRAGKLYARDMVLPSLKAPSTAHFGTPKGTVLADGTCQIEGWVDAQNSFGAMIRTTYTLHLTADLKNVLSLEYF